MADADMIKRLPVKKSIMQERAILILQNAGPGVTLLISQNHTGTSKGANSQTAGGNFTHRKQIDIFYSCVK